MRKKGSTDKFVRSWRSGVKINCKRNTQMWIQKIMAAKWSPEAVSVYIYLTINKIVQIRDLTKNEMEDSDSESD